jgi:hypothetical protein
LQQAVLPSLVAGILWKVRAAPADVSQTEVSC